MPQSNAVFDQAKAIVLSGKPLDDSPLERFIADVARTGPEDLGELLDAAREIRLARLGRAVSLCALINAKSGRCSEDCAFCAQSGHYRTGAPEHPFVDRQTILDHAQAMRQAGARRFGVVLSGKSPGTDDFRKLLEAIAAVADMGLLADTSCGILDRGELTALKRADCAGYHHNLETARSFFPSVCTTHDYEEDVRAVRLAREAKLYVCSGGIFGLGETWEQRAELALTLRELDVQSVPVNFLHPIPGTPLEHRPALDRAEALKIVALLRFLLPDKHIRICGGRQTVFGPERPVEPLEAGASALMIGDYLTTSGLDAARDLDCLVRAGWIPGRD